jgi:hypothetical protein
VTSVNICSARVGQIHHDNETDDLTVFDRDVSFIVRVNGELGVGRAGGIQVVAIQVERDITQSNRDCVTRISGISQVNAEPVVPRAADRVRNRINNRLAQADRCQQQNRCCHRYAKMVDFMD